MSDLEMLLNELVASAREDATDGFSGLSLTTKTTRREICDVFADLVAQRLNPMLAQVIGSAQRDARSGVETTLATQEALGRVREAYDELFDAAEDVA